MAKKKNHSVNISQAFEKISNLILNLATSLSEETDANPSIRDQHWMIFSDHENGSLEIAGEEVKQYYESFRALSRAIDPDMISEKALDQYLKETILKTLDINNLQPETTFEQRLKKELTNLRNKILAHPQKWRVYYRITGIEIGESPIRFGKIDFIVFSENHLDQYKSTLDQESIKDETRKACLHNLRELTEEPLSGKTVAIVETVANDVDAARTQALKELLLTIDAVNFYGDIIYPSKQVCITLFGSEQSSHETIPALMLSERTQMHQQQKLIGRIQKFSIQELLNGKGKQFGSERIHAILAKQDRNPIEDRVLSSIQWAGRATVDERQEEAFLLYAISLECLVMERGNEPELSYRLRMRIAHLLGKEMSGRKTIIGHIKRLYGIRSAIVHKGEYLIPETELELMRFFAKNAILRVLLEEPFLSLKNDEEFLGWFDEQLLK